MAQKRPGNLVAVWFNIIVCGGLVAFSIVFGLRSSGFGFLVAAIGLGMEVFFVRTLVELLKERRKGLARVAEDSDKDED